MLDQRTQETLANLISKCIAGENLIELNRLSLSEKFDFSPESFFSSITSNTAISARDLKLFLQEKNFPCKDSEIYMMIKQYSYRQDARISLEDFYQIFLPSTSDSLRERTINRPVMQNCSEYTTVCFMRVLQEELKLQRELEELKQTIYRQKDFTVYKAFETLAQGKQAIDENDLQRFMREFKVFVSNEDNDAFFRRVDLEDDRLISYNELLEFLVPFEVPDKEREKKASIEADERPDEEKQNEKAQETLDLSSEIPEKDKSLKLGDRLIELLLTLRAEEARKQELAMCGDLSVIGISKFIKANPDLTDENSGDKKRADYWTDFLSPYSKDYSILISAEEANLSDLSQNLLKSALVTIKTSQKTLKSFQNYLNSSLAVLRNEKDSDLSFEQVLKSFSEKSFKVPENDIGLLLSRLGLA